MTRRFSTVMRLLLVAVLLAGCSAPGEGAPEGNAIEFGPMDVTTTATEPFELRGPIRVAWQGDMFGIEAASEIDLPKRVQRDGDTVYSSNSGRGWIADPVGHKDLSERIRVWDLQRLAVAAGLRAEDGTVQGTTSVSHAGRSYEVALEVDVVDGRAVAARVAAPGARESPFTFEAVQEGLSFALGEHEPSRSRGEIRAIDQEAARGHDYIKRLILDHNERRGEPPERVDPDSLALEMAVRGGSWPESPYDGAAMENADRAGHFTWVRCPGGASFTGLGWDELTTFLVFGNGCQ